MKTIVIAGGSGFLGQIVKNYFQKKEWNIKILTRTPTHESDIYWDAKNLGKWTEALEHIDALINFTGKSVDCRYNEENKKLIHDSRIDSTHALGLAINLCDNPPKIWINSSTATIYKGSFTYLNDEENGIIGDDFSMNIAKAWEEAFYSILNPNTRKIVLRSSIVMGKDGGALPTLKKLVNFGLGGRQASGKQKVSWIHQEDFVRAIEFIIQHSELEGNFNLCVPQPTDNRTLMHAIRKTLNIPFGIAHPKWLLNLGAKILGTETELILKSRNVIPMRLLQNNFAFKYPDLKLALNNLLKN